MFLSAHNSMMNYYGSGIAIANVQVGYTVWVGNNRNAEPWIVTDKHRDDKSNTVTITVRKGDEVQTITAPEVALLPSSPVNYTA